MRYEKPIFPMKYMAITQGYNGNYSHKGSMAIDIAGKDRGIDDATAPATSIIKRISGSNVYLETINQVKWANGTVDYATFMLAHDNNVKDLRVGQIIPQGKIFYQEGTAGNATGNHIHLTIAKGRYAGGFYNTYKNWCLKNQVAPETCLWVKTGTNIIKDGGYKWVYTDSDFYETQTDLRRYIVQRGDTLIKIGRKFGVNWVDIAVLNKITPPKYIIKVGQILTIPNGR